MQYLGRQSMHLWNLLLPEEGYVTKIDMGSKFKMAATTILKFSLIAVTGLLLHTPCPGKKESMVYYA